LRGLNLKIANGEFTPFDGQVLIKSITDTLLQCPDGILPLLGITQKWN
jgi:hypothetical protein